MTALFLLNNSIDVANDDSLSSMMIFLAICFISLIIVLYSGEISQWRAERKERTKWLYWNRG